MSKYLPLLFTFVLAACANQSLIDQGINASRTGVTSFVEVVLDKGLDVNAQNKDGVTMLMAASVIDDIDIIKLLIRRGANLDTRNNRGETALVFAAYYGQTEAGKLLLESGADLNIRIGKNYTPLIYACSNEQIDFALMLIESGADIHATTDWGYTALHSASSHGLAEVVRSLIFMGVDVNKKEKLNNDSALNYAAGAGHLDIVKQLIEANAEIDIVGLDGCTAYLVSKMYGYDDVSQTLILAGAVISLGLEQCKKAAQKTLSPEEKENKFIEIKEEARKKVDYTDGLVLLRDKRYQEAITKFTEYLEANPDSLDAYYNRGLAYGYSSDYEQAANNFSQMLKVNPESGLAYKERCAAFLRLKKNKKAISDCNKAIELGVKTYQVYHNRGIAKYYLGEYEQSASDLSKAIELSPNDAKSFESRCLAYSQLEELDKAFEDCSKTIELNPKSVWAYWYRGQLFKNRSEYDHAINDFKKSIDNNPNYTYALNSLAWLQATAKDPRYRNGKEAILHAEKAVSLTNRKDALILETLAAAYAENEKFKEAASTIREAIQNLKSKQKEIYKLEYEKILSFYEKGKKYY